MRKLVAINPAEDQPQTVDTVAIAFSLATQFFAYLSSAGANGKEQEELKQNITILQAHGYGGEVAILETEAYGIEQEMTEMVGRVDDLEDEVRELPEEIAEALQQILDFTPDIAFLRRRMEGFRDALRANLYKPIKDCHDLDANQLVITAIQSAPRSA